MALTKAPQYSRQASPPEPADQLDAYSKASTIYSQIAGFQTWLMACATLFFSVTVAAWAAILSHDAPRGVRLALCIVHLIACLWLIGTFYGAIRSIRARFFMFDVLASRYFPDILTTGRASFGRPLPKWVRPWLSSGKQSWSYFFFYLLPLVAAAGTVYLLVHDVS